MIFGFELDWKTTLAFISFALALGSYVPYVYDIIHRRIHPHAYTWLIWSITQGVASAGLWYGHGGWVAVSLAIGSLFVFSIFLLSLKYGTKDITKSDTIVLCFALLAIVVWWQLDNPLLAVLMVSLIDVIGYIPTYRKSLTKPWSESLLAWILVSASYIFALGALAEHNLLTVSYLVSIFFANMLLILLCLVRRTQIPNPN